MVVMRPLVLLLALSTGCASVSSFFSGNDDPLYSTEGDENYKKGVEALLYNESWFRQKTPVLYKKVLENLLFSTDPVSPKTIHYVYQTSDGIGNLVDIESAASLRN